MICECCKVAKSFAQFRQFSLTCKFCGARLIQALGLLPISVEAVRDRRLKALADWLEYGHKETEIRGLIIGPQAIGPGPVLVSESPAPQKRRSVGLR